MPNRGIGFFGGGDVNVWLSNSIGVDTALYNVEVKGSFADLNVGLISYSFNFAAESSSSKDYDMSYELKASELWFSAFVKVNYLM